MNWKNIFAELCKLPRPSGMEGAVSKWIVNFLKAYGYEPQLDAMGNIGVDIDATQGSNVSPRILFQSHIDMVCYGGNDIVSTDIEIVDGWMQSKDQQTTLGADNGIGVALALALVTEPDISHGPISLLFTVDEERGLTGARGFDPRIVAEDIDLVINLDSEEGVEYICNGSAGGATVEVDFALVIQNFVPNDVLSCFEISLSGLLGGHSGVDIHQERGNAIVLLWELIDRLPCIGVVSCRGGSARNAIPAYASCIIATNDICLDDIRSQVAVFVDEQQSRYPGLCIDVMKSAAVDSCIHINTWNTYRNLLRSIPLGVIEILPDQPDRVITSNNLGLISIDANSKQGSFVFLARSADDQKVTHLVKQIIAQISQGLSESNISVDQYGGWQELADSIAIAAVKQAVVSLGHIPLIAPYHAGLEVSEILKKLPNHVSGVSIGPLMYDVHSPQERVSIQSVEEVWWLINKILITE